MNLLFRQVKTWNAVHKVVSNLWMDLWIYLCKIIHGNSRPSDKRLKQCKSRCMGRKNIIEKGQNFFKSGTQLLWHNKISIQLWFIWSLPWRHCSNSKHVSILTSWRRTQNLYTMSAVYPNSFRTPVSCRVTKLTISKTLTWPSKRGQ